MTAARDDDFMALPGMEADSTDTRHGRERLSDEATPSSSKSALDALLDEYRARATSEREKGTLFGCSIVMNTSSTPCGKCFMKVSHPHVRAKSPRRKYCRGGAKPYSRQDIAIAPQGSTRSTFELLSPKIHIPDSAVQQITTYKSHIRVKNWNS
ncbi:hypothetical protein [Actinomyces bouchesdurhonensis]|uniref:hypothetical protein n=1 Tax=Actinomyces bouchesdurhonensis TaxID=1852361 RepID=UPI0023EFBA58|nr:hypothetical protein [Actinomyces bouchesdurhonensis]